MSDSPKNTENTEKAEKPEKPEKVAGYSGEPVERKPSVLRGQPSERGIGGPTPAKVDGPVAEDAVEVKGAKKGHLDDGFRYTEGFEVELRTQYGIQQAAISPRGWVGPPALVIASSGLKDLRKLIDDVLGDRLDVVGQ